MPRLIILLLSISLLACNTDQKLSPVQNGGVVISFDDRFVDEWHSADKTLSKYNWKASFCVCQFDLLSDIEIEKLQRLQAEGHEIAAHGMHHVNATNYVKKNGMQQYIDYEITPLLSAMKEKGFQPTSFAFPYGASTPAIRKELLRHFGVVRGTGGTLRQPHKQICYFNKHRQVEAFCIDYTSKNFSPTYLTRILNHANRKNAILILYAHRPVENASVMLDVNLSTLEYVCNYVTENNMKFYTLSDLNQLLTKP